MSYGIVVKGLTVAGQHRRPILEGISLDIAPGTMVGVVGKSGAGKSTLLKRLGLLLPEEGRGDRGEIYLRHDADRISRIITEDNHRSLLHVTSFVPQSDLFVEELTGAETLRQACIFSGCPPADLKKRSSALLGAVGLPQELGERRVKDLSGGQRRRLSIARALASDAATILLLDEPTSGLDLPVAQEIMDLLERLCRERGMTVVCTSHLPTTLRGCDRVLVLSPGEEGGGAYLARDYSKEEFTKLLGDGADVGQIYSNVSPKITSSTGSDGPDGILVPPPKTPDRERWKRDHFKSVLGVDTRSLSRDRLALLIFLSQPVLLGVVVVVTQGLHGKDAAPFVDFFLSVSALWIGMSLCIREFVSERERYALSELSGLTKNSYFAAKLAFAAAGTAVGVIILCLVAHLTVAVSGYGELEAMTFGSAHIVTRIFLLWLTGASGAMIGLLISALARSERMAISLMPLALLPQVVFSRFACGFAEKLKNDTGYPYVALQTLIGSDQVDTVGWVGLQWVNFWAGFFMTTRHSNWCLNSLDSTKGFLPSSFFWWDFTVLVLLGVFSGLAVYGAFMYNSDRWRSLIR